MASGGNRGGAGERVLESRHVIGLFMVIILLSGVFFTLGFVMGRSQSDSTVNAATDFFKKPVLSIPPKPDVVSKKTAHAAPTEKPTDTAPPPNSDWEFYHAGDSKKTEDRLKPSAPAPAATHKSEPMLVKTTAAPRTAGGSAKSTSSPLIPGGAYTLQVAAVKKEADALELAKSLQKKKFPAFVLSPQSDKYYRVLVGPYAEQKAADAARKGLEGAGFKAFVKH
jgi:septal ring-binding cell division protein DamX